MIKVAQCDEALVRTIETRLGLPPLIARILVARGVRSPEAVEAFLSPKLETLSNPFLLPDMKRACLRQSK